MILPPDSNLLLHENSTISLASGQLRVKFFPGCLPVLPWPHLSWVSPQGLPGACSSSTILIWLNTWFILSLRWGRPFVLIGPVNLQPPFRAIYWPGLRGGDEGKRLQFSIYPLSQKRHLKAPIHCYCMWFPRAWIDFSFSRLHLLWMAYL